MEKHIIILSVYLQLQRVEDNAGKRVRGNASALSFPLPDQHAYEPGTVLRQHKGTHTWNVLVFFQNPLNLINIGFGDFFCISVNNIGDCGWAHPGLFCNILYPDHM